MFSLHLMISDMSGYITSEPETIVNVDCHVMVGCLREKKAEKVIIFAHLYLLSQLQNIIFNDALF